ncbi:hypothetical protein CLAFUW4_06421 [Fulvia fulva]|uniref:Uncharacterized protein n=1 Tax=Passalora fulva TaxID=5499 RepID=A0A9Q8LIP5_PASFU|nr:uncharacterized protein CLAFUR5_06564 [Fulvia fulva]KAK4623785.1 hypothetical protein CLAFUR4_06424 [Fulvia fulva]KAK4624781.1 hypothetical protein CLAFUR0_06425 [Fulvia fulva]UJO18217.1 hypothetical protein CLAFUR5_06564 [Fulvia fulva]WPV14951.1 hypothetical protein CLAFUW4_06421 [Fulvia fulva]WPV29548.1 hypothetical protein CLAFUW7_06420 [Fulvia fulva]
MSSPYKKVLLIGATSGIGARFAQTLVDNDVFVIVVGRRQDRLGAFVQKNGKDNGGLSCSRRLRFGSCSHLQR